MLVSGLFSALNSEPENPAESAFEKPAALIGRDVLTLSAESHGVVVRTPCGRTTEVPYKFLTIRTTRSFCEGIWFAPRVRAKPPDNPALKTILF
jgi:hypothetical protein